MKIAQINSVCGISSTGRIASDISETAKKHGIENRVFYGFLEDPTGNGTKFNSDFNVHADAALTRLFGNRGHYNRKATQKLISELEAYKPDVIHLHNIHGQYLNVPMLCEYICRIDVPVVCTLHDCWLFTGDCFYFDKCGCNAWETGCPRNCPFETEMFTNKICNSSKKNWEEKKALISKIRNLTIVTPSVWLADLTARSFLGNAKIMTINNGIDISSFCPTKSDFRKKYDLQNKFVVMGMCFTLDSQDRKGGHYLIELADKLPDSCAIVILGMDKPNEDMAKNVIFIPKTNSVKELAEVYSAADVFVNPTLEDNFPTVNLEALSCGTPVITFDTGGSPEAVDANTGKVVKKGDAKGLLEAIEEIMAVGKNKYENCCRQRAKQLFSRELMCERYITVYNKLSDLSNKR